MRRAGFDGQILAVTAGESEQEAVQLIEADVAGTLHKHNPMEVLCSAIRQVASGKAGLEKAHLGPLFRSVNLSRAVARPWLTGRDRVALRFIFWGLTNREIAERLEISEGAVKSSLRPLMPAL